MRLILILAILTLAAGCTRYRDGTWQWHTLGGEPGERSAKAVDVLDQIDGTADAQRRQGVTR